MNSLKDLMDTIDEDVEAISSDKEKVEVKQQIQLSIKCYIIEIKKAINYYKECLNEKFNSEGDPFYEMIAERELIVADKELQKYLHYITSIE